MTQVIQSPRRRPMPALHLIGTAGYVAIALCWAGIVPAWRLAPEPVQPALQAALHPLFWPALAIAGAVLAGALLKVSRVLRGTAARAVDLVLQVAGIFFACIALRAVGGLSFAGYGLGWDLVDACLRVGAAFAATLLPWVAIIAAVGGLVTLLRHPAPRPA